MFNLFTFIFLTIGLYNGQTFCVETKFSYPNVHRDTSVSDNMFGTVVSDPYRWLEDSKSKETAKFVEDQNAITNEYIKKNTQYKAVSSSFGILYNYTNYGIPSKHGNKYYMTINSGLQNQGIIYSFDSLTDTGKVFLDPNKFSSDGTISLTFTSFSRDGKYCAYGKSVGGSDWITISIIDVETGKELPEILKKIKFSTVDWNKNNKGFFYSYFDKFDGNDEGTETEIPTFQKLYYHKLNTNQSEDIQIFGFPKHPKWLIGTPVVSDSGKEIHIFPAEGTSKTPWFFARFDPEQINGSFDFQPIVPVANAEYHYIESDNKCAYVRTNYEATNFRIVCVDLNNPDPSNWVDVLPENKQWVLTNSIIVNKNNLVIVYMIDVVNIIQIYELDTGKYLFDVDTPIGTISSLDGDKNGTEFFFKFSTLLSPGIIYRYDFSVKPNKVDIFKESTIEGLNMDEFQINQIFYTSKDGTKIPMFFVHRKGLVKNGKNPTLLYAYGGFNINIQPSYSVLGMFFVKNFDGIYAEANIRGGGEYGEEWHKAGMLLNKQNVFDDFAYAGSWLIQNGYTSRDYLTISGRSNGGLLVGASSNQYSEIFGASLASVGVMDMVRFPLFTIGYAWIEEYGDPQNNETMFKYIYNYSPLHNVKDNVSRYPNMLVLTADHDDRVVPAHSYKFISELQYKLGKKFPETPMMIRIDSNSGHGAGKPISKWIEEYTDCVCFLMNSMNYSFHP